MLFSQLTTTENQSIVIYLWKVEFFSTECGKITYKLEKYEFSNGTKFGY